MSIRRAAIVAPVRTPVGTFGGSLRAVPVEDLAATAIKAVLERTGIDPELIDDVLFAQSYVNGETPCIGRWAALHAGLPVSVPGLQIDRRCGGGLQAVVTAAMMVQTGAADVVLAGGVESMSNIEYYTTDVRWGASAREPGPVRPHRPGPGAIAAGMAVRQDLRDDRDRGEPAPRNTASPGTRRTPIAARSQQRAAAAWDAGRFDDEVVPIQVPQRRGDPVTVSRDEGVRPDTTAETLAKLRTIMPGGTVTAGNSSQQNDAAAACLVVAEDRLGPLGLEPLGYLAGWAAAGCEPATMGIGPVPAVEKLFSRTGLGFPRHRPRRAQRGVRGPGARRAGRLAVERAGPAQRQRIRHLARAPDRRHRRPDARHRPARASPPRAAATCWRRCASAAARAWPRSSRPPDRRIESGLNYAAVSNDIRARREALRA